METQGKDKFREDLNNLHNKIVDKQKSDLEDAKSYIEQCKEYFTNKKNNEKEVNQKAELGTNHKERTL